LNENSSKPQPITLGATDNTSSGSTNTTIRTIRSPFPIRPLR
jgi:hypothetical protein